MQQERRTLEGMPAQSASKTDETRCRVLAKQGFQTSNKSVVAKFTQLHVCQLIKFARNNPGEGVMAGTKCQQFCQKLCLQWTSLTANLILGLFAVLPYVLSSIAWFDAITTKKAIGS